VITVTASADAPAAGRTTTPSAETESAATPP
jgi:hypothetical protein